MCLSFSSDGRYCMHRIGMMGCTCASQYWGLWCSDVRSNLLCVEVAYSPCAWFGFHCVPSSSNSSATTMLCSLILYCPEVWIWLWIILSLYGPCDWQSTNPMRVYPASRSAEIASSSTEIPKRTNSIEKNIYICALSEPHLFSVGVNRMLLPGRVAILQLPKADMMLTYKPQNIGRVGVTHCTYTHVLESWKKKKSMLYCVQLLLLMQSKLFWKARHDRADFMTRVTGC